MAERKKDFIKIVIWDSKTRNWEFNELVHPLMNDYNTGMCSVKTLKYESKSFTYPDDITEEHIIKGQKWYFYIWFGFDLGLRLLKEKFLVRA